MDLAALYIHDAQLLRVTEDTVSDTLTMDIELPVSEDSDDLQPARLVFLNAYNYQVVEIPFAGPPEVLSLSVSDADMSFAEDYGKNRFKKVRFETNAGYREVCYETVKLQSG